VATSGTYTFTVNRDEIIRESLLNLGVLEESEIPTAQETTDCARKLSMIAKQLAGTMDKAPGFKMWQRERGDLFLSTTQFAYDLGSSGAATSAKWAGKTTGIAEPNTYNQTTLLTGALQGATSIQVTSIANINNGDFIGVMGASDIQWTTVNGVPSGTTVPIAPLPGAVSGSATVWNYTTPAQRPVEIVTALLRDSNSTDTSLTRMTVEVYEALPTKVATGYLADPTAFYYEPRLTNNAGRLYIDCAGAQDPTKRIHLVYLRQVQDFNNPGDNPDFPQEWFNHLSWALSLACHSMFDVDWTQGMQMAFANATSPAREQSPSTTQAYFQPDDDDNN
jgi:hypothetical protein